MNRSSTCFFGGWGSGRVVTNECGLSNLPSECVRRSEKLQLPLSMALSVFQVLSHTLKVVNWLEEHRADYPMVNWVTCSLFISRVAWSLGDGLLIKPPGEK